MQMRHRREDALVRWIVAILLSATLAGAAFAQQRLTLNFVNAEIEAVGRAMADFTGRTIIVDPRVKGTVTLTVEQQLTPDQAVGVLSSALRLQNIGVVASGGVTRIVPEADARLQGGPVHSGAPAARGDEIVTQIFRLNYESAVNIAQNPRPLVASDKPNNPPPRDTPTLGPHYPPN